MKNCIKEANTKIVADIKKRFNKTNMFITGVISLLVVEFIIIAETLEIFIPNPQPFVRTTVAILVVLFLAVQVVYAYYVYEACNKKDVP